MAQLAPAKNQTYQPKRSVLEDIRSRWPKGDLGWDYYVKETAQKAADSAALAMVGYAFSQIGQGSYLREQSHLPGLDQLCELELACSVGDRPTGVTVTSPVD